MSVTPFMDSTEVAAGITVTIVTRVRNTLILYIGSVKMEREGLNDQRRIHADLLKL